MFKRLLTPKPSKPKEWFEIEVPVIAQRNDYVSYKTIGKKHSHDHLNRPCYSGSMLNLSKFNFLCRPNYGSKSLLPKEIYLRWMQLCKDYGLAPTTSEAFVEKGKNYFRCKGHNKHRVYAALCCYRWADNLAPLPYTVVTLLDMNSQLSFYQVLHYALSKYIQNSNHNFVSIAAGGAYSYFPSHRLNLLSMISVWLFFNHPEGRKNCYYRKWKDGQTHGRIAQVPAELGFKDGEGFIVKNPGDLLWEDWSMMYHLPNPTKEVLTEYYKSVIKFREAKQ